MKAKLRDAMRNRNAREREEESYADCVQGREPG